MLARSLRVSTAAIAASWAAPLLASPGSRWFKLGACEWSLGKSDPSCFEVAKQIGLDGVQLNLGSVRNGMHLLKPDVQKAYLAAARAAGLEIGPCLAMGELNSVPLKSDPRAARWLADSVGVCKALGITMTMPAFFGRGELDMQKTDEIDRVVGILKDVAPEAQKQGVTIALENYLSAADNMKIIQRVGSPAVKVYYDVGNSTDKGYDIYREIRLLGNLICEFHAKDGRFLLGQGRVDFKKVRAAIDDIGFNGWLVLECARPHGIVEDYTAQARFLRTLFPERK
jgi:sugar phosphate isomerase/epimerase